MRISETRQIGATRKSSNKKRTNSSDSVFSLNDPADSHPVSSGVQIGSVVPVGDISSLLVVQGTLDEPHRAGAINQGFDTLDALDSLKIDVLSGGVSRHKLMHLAKLVEKQRSNLSDPELGHLLDHIELRARVELAKYEKNYR